MSDIGAILHVKKDGVQYDAHAYTTIDECPAPHLKIRFNETNAFVKLENRGNGDVPLYVRMRSGEVYQVKKEAIPSGRLILNSNYHDPDVHFTVPKGCTIIKVIYNSKRSPDYISVYPNSYHNLRFTPPSDGGSETYLYCSSHSESWMRGWCSYGDPTILEWSSEINKHSPTLSDH